MKVALVFPGWPREPVGGYKVAYQYANYLVEHGHQVTLLHAKTFPGQPVGQSVTRADQLKYLLNVRAVVKDFTAIARDSTPWWYPVDPRIAVTNRARATMADLAGQDVIVATAVETARFVAEAARTHDAAGAYFIQHFEEWNVGTAAVEESWRLPLHRIVIAPWLADIGTRLGVQTALVPNAIDREEFPRGPRTGDRPLTLGAMISPVPIKRADLLVEVFRRVREVIPDVQGRAFGVDDPPADLPSYVEYVKQPTREQLRSIYQGIRVYLCASDGEGWHLPPAEAMVSGAAVVSTDISGVRVYAEGSAALVPVGDVDALTSAVIDLLRDEARNAELAERGFASLTAYTLTDAGAAFERELVAARSRTRIR